jgi:hypothetical protein
MIISDEITKFDNSYTMVQYKTDKNGNPEEIIDTPPVAGKLKHGDDLYQAKATEFERLKNDFLNGSMSPIKLYTVMQNLDPKDLASRIKLSPSKVKKHLTPEGFKKATVDVLQKYAKVFEVTIADFFHIISLKKGINIEENKINDRMIQEITIKK